MSDVSILCEDEVFDLHSPVLSHASDYFREMLTNGEKDMVVDITLGIGANEFSILVESMYTGNVRGITVNNVLNVLKASHHFQMEMAKNHCIHFMIDNMNVNNCMEFWIAGEKIDSDVLMREAVIRIGRHLLEISRSKSFLNLDLMIVEKILRDDFLFVSSESDVFEAILAWINYDIASRRSSFCVLLEALRMIYVTDSYLIKVIGKDDLILTDSKALIKYSMALQMKLEQKPSSIRKRHGIMYGMLGRFDSIFANSSPMQAISYRSHEIIKSFHGGLFTRCCTLDDGHQTVRSSFETINMKIIQPVESAIGSVQKQINPIFKNAIESMNNSLGNMGGKVLESVKLCGQHILQHGDKHQVEDLGNTVTLVDDNREASVAAVIEGSRKIYDLSRIDDGGIISSFSFDDPLEHISEDSDEDRESMHSELESDNLLGRSDEKNIRCASEQMQINENILDQKNEQVARERFEDEILLSELLRVSEDLDDDEIHMVDETLNRKADIIIMNEVEKDGSAEHNNSEIMKLSNNHDHSHGSPENGPPTFENNIAFHSDLFKTMKQNLHDNNSIIEFHTDDDSESDDHSSKVEFTEGSSRGSDRVAFEDDCDSDGDYERDYHIDENTSKEIFNRSFGDSDKLSFSDDASLDDIRCTSFNDSDKLSFHDDSSRCSEILTFEDTDEIVDLGAEENDCLAFETIGQLNPIVSRQ